MIDFEFILVTVKSREQFDHQVIRDKQTVPERALVPRAPGKALVATIFFDQDFTIVRKIAGADKHHVFDTFELFV